MLRSTPCRTCFDTLYLPTAYPIQDNKKSNFPDQFPRSTSSDPMIISILISRYTQQSGQPWVDLDADYYELMRIFKAFSTSVAGPQQQQYESGGGDPRHLPSRYSGLPRVSTPASIGCSLKKSCQNDSILLVHIV